MTYDYDSYVKAWGSNLPVIVGGTGEEHMVTRLPALPADHIWLWQREVTPGKDDAVSPTYRLLLIHNQPVEDGINSVALGQGRIDKGMYGEAGVYELARNLKEKHVQLAGA